MSGDDLIYFEVDEGLSEGNYFLLSIKSKIIEIKFN